MKLNLGCGHRLLDGFVNVDLPGNWSNKLPDVAADVTKRLPFDDGSAEEVHAYHVLEHIWRWQVEDTLRDWVRVLAPGGQLVLEMPCFEKVFGYIARCARQGEALEPRMSVWAMYGDPNYKSEAMTHKWLWSKAELRDVLTGLGLVDVAVEAPHTHIAARDMRMVARKPA